MMKHLTGAFSAAILLVVALAGLPTTSVYAEENGPVIILMTVTPDPAFLGGLVTIHARAASGDFPNAPYPEYAEFNVNGGPWTSMPANDGTFDYFFEDVTGSYTATTLGSNVVCAEAYAGGYWSYPNCIEIFVYNADTTGPTTSAVAASPNPAFNGDLVTVTATVDDSATGFSDIFSAEFNVNGGAFTAMTASDGSFDDFSEVVTGSFTATTAGLNTVCVQGTDALGNVGAAACIDLTVQSGYTFTGFLAPANTAGTKAHAGHKFSLRFRLTMTADGSAVSDPSAINGVMSYDVDCTTLAGDTSSAVSESGPGNPDLDYLGNGTWIFNWRIPDSYGGTCRMIFVSFSDGSMSPSALFRFR